MYHHSRQDVNWLALQTMNCSNRFNTQKIHIHFYFTRMESQHWQCRGYIPNGWRHCQCCTNITLFIIKHQLSTSLL